MRDATASIIHGFPAAARPLALAALLGLPLIGGCNNPCQSLCVEISDVAKRDCGLEFSASELDQCIADYAGGNLDKGLTKTCRDGKGTVADEWDCSEMAVYFSSGTTTTGGTGSDGGTDGGTDTGT